MTIRFHYKKIIGFEGKTQRIVAIRPIIPLRIRHGNRQIRYEALVDSGADFCIFHAELGRILGFDVEKGIRRLFGGVTGQAGTAFIHPVTIDLEGYETEINCGFSDDISGDGYGILGQDGFFDNFKVMFDKRAGKVELVPKIIN